MTTLLTALTLGATLGFSAGIAPGPMTTLVLSESLRGGSKDGAKIAVAPLVTDVPILLIALWLSSKLGTNNMTLGILSLAGAGMMFYLAWDGWRTNAETLVERHPSSHNVFVRGLITSALSPSPLLFWLTIGMEKIRVTFRNDLSASVAFIAAFYAILLLSKLLLAWTSGRSKAWFAGSRLLWIHRGLACVILLFGISTLRQGLELLGG